MNPEATGKGNIEGVGAGWLLARLGLVKDPGKGLMVFGMVLSALTLELVPRLVVQRDPESAVGFGLTVVDLGFVGLLGQTSGTWSCEVLHRGLVVT